MGEKQQCVVASHTPPTGDLAYNPGMYLDWESNMRPFGSQARAQSTESHQPGLELKVFMSSENLRERPLSSRVEKLSKVKISFARE